PGSFHHLHVTSAQAAFPDAKTWICPGIETKRPDGSTTASSAIWRPRTGDTGGALRFGFKHGLRMWGNPRPAPEYRMGWTDRAAAGKSLRHILDGTSDRMRTMCR